MGLQQPHVLGRHQIFMMREESSPGTFAAPVGTDAARIIDSTFDYKEDEEPRGDWQLGTVPFEEIQMPGEFLFNWNQYMIGSGVAGTPCDAHSALRMAMGATTAGASTNTPATSERYNLESVQMAMALSLSRAFNANQLMVREDLYGAIIDEFKTVASGGGDPPKWSFSGEARGLILTGYGTIQSSTATTLTLAAGEGDGFMAGSLVTADGDDNGGVGYAIDSVDYATSVLTDAAAAGWGAPAASSPCAPFCPTPTTAGSPISSKLGSLTVDSLALPVTAFECTVSRNYDKVKDELFSNGMTDAISGNYAILVKLTVRMRRDQANELHRRRRFGTRNLVCAFGNVAGNIFTYSLPQQKFRVSGMSTPEGDGTVTAELSGIALDSSDNANDALSILGT